MKRVLIAIAYLSMAACSKHAGEDAAQTAAATAPAPAPDSAAMVGEVRTAVEAFFDAMTRADTVALDSMMHGSAVFVAGDGTVASHEERLAHHRAGRIKVTKTTNEILHVQTFGDDFALVQVRSTSEGETNGVKWVPALIVVGLARQPGAPWQVVYHQAVRQVAVPKPM